VYIDMGFGGKRETRLDESVKKGEGGLDRGSLRGRLGEDGIQRRK
jgi:hypothetical protein